MKTMKAKGVYIATAKPCGLLVEGLDGIWYYALIHPRETLLDRLKPCCPTFATTEKMWFTPFEAWHFYRIEIVSKN